MATATPNRPAARNPLETAKLFDALQQAQRVDDGGELAEQRHLLDEQPCDCLHLPGIAHPKTGGTS